MNFLISYHRPTGAVDLTAYMDQVEAADAVLGKELKETDPDMEQVVIIADSLETVKTHSRYFMGHQEITHP